MVSFASPLFWQIHYLVTNLSKKNFKTNVAELNQVSARIVYLASVTEKKISFIYLVMHALPCAA